ncbi:MAG: cytidine deaminase [Candidatus Cryptobacteroides sp.]
MKNITLEIHYEEFSGIEELDRDDRELCEAAVKALDGSYAPYSRFNVGAAVRLADGTIVSGANQENAASPSGLCAERTAMFAANFAHPGVPMCSIAIVGAQNGEICRDITSPCGACRQVMAEYQQIGGRNMSVLLYSNGRILKFGRVDDILPFIFDNLQGD